MLRRSFFKALAGAVCGGVAAVLVGKDQSFVTDVVGTDTAKLRVSSTTKVANLNVDMMDGLDIRHLEIPERDRRYVEFAREMGHPQTTLYLTKKGIFSV